MFKRPRLLSSLLLCFSLSFVGCGKDEETKKDDDESSEEEDDDSTSGKGDKKTTKEDDSTSDGKDKTTKDDTTKDGDSLVAARKFFKTECAGCHGDNGEKAALGKALKFDSAEAKKWEDDYIAKVIEEGKGKSMPKYKEDLEKADLKVKSLVDLIRCFQEKSDPSDCGK